MKIKWSKLLAMLKSRGYSGNGSLKSVKAFVDDEAIELIDANGNDIDLDKLHKNKTVTISADAGEEVIILESEIETESEHEDDEEAKAEDEDEEDDDEMAKAYAAGRSKGRREKIAGVRAGAVTSRVTKVNASGSKVSALIAQYDNRVAHKHAIPNLDKRPAFDSGSKAMAFGAFTRVSFAEQCPQKAGMVAQYRDGDLAVLGDYFGLGRKASSTMDLTAGAGFIPEDFSSNLIENVEDYGVARANAQVESMSHDVMHFPVHTTDTTWSVVGEGASITESDPANSQVKLTAAKWGFLTRASSELMNDSLIGIADYVGRVAGRSLAQSEDTSVFIGDASSSHRFISGVSTRLQDVDGAGTDSFGLNTQGTGNTIAAIVLQDFYDTIGLAPAYAIQSGRAKWYCSSQFYYTVMLPLIQAIGGVSQAEMEGGPGRSFLGHPVEFVQVMPTATATTTVFCHFGDLSAGVLMGTVAGTMQLDFSDQRYFDTDQIAFRALQRTAINVHDVGDSAATKAGPIVGLETGS